MTRATNNMPDGKRQAPSQLRLLRLWMWTSRIPVTQTDYMTYMRELATEDTKSGDICCSSCNAELFPARLKPSSTGRMKRPCPSYFPLRARRPKETKKKRPTMAGTKALQVRRAMETLWFTRRRFHRGPCPTVSIRRGAAKAE